MAYVNSIRIPLISLAIRLFLLLHITVYLLILSIFVEHQEGNDFEMLNFRVMKPNML